MALYHRYRPASYEEMVGNKSEFQVLEQQIKQGTHAFLLVGPSGCGKTTIARIAAKSINANVIEVNSSDNRGIDTVREIIDTIKFKPLGNSKIVYILDECHKTTNEFQNALLKPLEDCPDWVYFFLGTTNPEKMIKAVHTRCSRVSLSAISKKDLQTLIIRVATQEKAPKWLVDNMVPIIIDNADCSARQALVLLEKMLLCKSIEEATNVCYNIEAEDMDTIGLCRAVIAGDWNLCRQHLTLLQGKDAENIRRTILGFASKVALGGNARGIDVLRIMRQDVFSSGFPGLVYLVAEITNGGRR